MAVEYGLITKDMKEKDIVKEISKQLELFFIGKSKYDIRNGSSKVYLDRGDPYRRRILILRGTT